MIAILLALAALSGASGCRRDRTITYGYGDDIKVVVKPATLSVRVGDTIALKHDGDSGDEEWLFAVSEGSELLEYTRDGYVAKGAGVAKVYFFVRGLYCDGAYATISIR